MTEPGYAIDRDDDGLTRREREVRRGLRDGLDQPGIAESLGITKQRVNQIVASLTKKGAVSVVDGKVVVSATRNS
jgi:DNA-binding NarL/FixJ family response regulator